MEQLKRYHLLRAIRDHVDLVRYFGLQDDPLMTTMARGTKSGEFGPTEDFNADCEPVKGQEEVRLLLSQWVHEMPARYVLKKALMRYDFGITRGRMRSSYPWDIWQARHTEYIDREPRNKFIHAAYYPWKKMKNAISLSLSSVEIAAASKHKHVKIVQF